MYTSEGIVLWYWPQTMNTVVSVQSWVSCELKRQPPPTVCLSDEALNWRPARSWSSPAKKARYKSFLYNLLKRKFNTIGVPLKDHSPMYGAPGKWEQGTALCCWPGVLLRALFVVLLSSVVLNSKDLKKYNPLTPSCCLQSLYSLRRV